MGGLCSNESGINHRRNAIINDHKEFRFNVCPSEVLSVPFHYDYPEDYPADSFSFGSVDIWMSGGVSFSESHGPCALPYMTS